MENIKQCFHKICEIYRGICVVNPKLDGPLFLREFFKSLCIYIILKHGFFSVLSFTIYHTICRNKNTSLRQFSSEIELSYDALQRFYLSFFIRCIVFWYIYSLTFPSLILHTIIRIYFYPSSTFLQYFDDGFQLEERSSERDGMQLIEQKTQGPADAKHTKESGIDQTDYSAEDEVVLCETGLDRRTSISSQDNGTDNLQVKWINLLIGKLWPHIGAYIEDHLMYKILEDQFITFKDKSLISGKIPPRVSSVNIRDEEESMFIDFDIRYDGDCTAYLKKWLIEVQVDHLQIDVQIQIELKNFVGMQPFIGEIIIHMNKLPTLDLRFKKTVGFIDKITLIKEAILSPIRDTIQNIFPISFPLIPDDI